MSVLDLTVKIDSKSVQQALKGLPNKVVVPATVRALNKVAANVRTAASQAIRKRIAVPAARVREGITIRRASKAKLQSTLVISGKPIPLKDFRARATKRGVTAAIRGRGRTLYKGSFIVAKIGDNVFIRDKGAGRLPIKKLVGPSLPSVFSNQQVREQTLDVAKEVLPKRLAEEVRFELLRLSR